jgi:hypothetical protein
VVQKPVPLFFGFPDGVFHYVCAECDARCCRGQGFGGSLTREMGFLFQEYPGLATMTHMRQRDLMDVATPAGSCFFLRGDNLCQIEVEHGRSRKPGVCLVFPFNRFVRIGNTIVVTPHILCPLRVQVPARPGVYTGTHAALEATIRESEMLDEKYVKWYLHSATLPPKETSESVLKQHAQFRETCAAAIGNSRFIDVLTASGANVKELSAFLNRTATLMHWSQPQTSTKRDGIDDVLIALAQPMLVEWTSSPRPRALRALALGERLIRTLFTVQIDPPRPQAIYSVLHQSIAVLSLLSYGDERTTNAPRKRKAPFGNSELVFASFIAQRDMKSQGVFSALEKAFKHLPSPADRTVLTHHLAQVVR